MADVLHKTADPVDYRQSVHTPNFPAAAWFHEPDISAVAAVPTTYWRVGTNPVEEMSAAEKTAVDDAAAAAVTAANRTGAISVTAEVSELGVEIRALIELFNKRDNYLVSRLTELQAALDAVRDTGGDANARLDTLPASWLATNTRTKADAVQDYTDDINAGNQDT